MNTVLIKISQKFTLAFFTVSIMIVPIVSIAQTSPTNQRSYCSGFTGSLDLDSGKTVTDILKYGTCFIQNSIIPLLFAVAVLVFIYGVVDFIRASANGEKDTAKKKEFMVWGIVALAVMTGVWGLVSIVTNTFGIGNVIPQLPVNAQ